MNAVFSILALLMLFALFGLLLGYFAQRFKVEADPLVDKIDAILPQTQCGQCGFPGCRPYAEAIAKDEADINCCPPGGQEGVEKLAALLGVEAKALDESRGTKKLPQVVYIIEDWCIGCTRCIKACPVDAIVGTNQRMHTVIEDECTGCELCISPCPVDCIIVKPRHAQPWQWQKPSIGLPS